MTALLNLFARLTGIGGALVCAAAGVARIAGEFYLGPFQATTLFTVGTALMVLACLIRLELLHSRVEHLSR